MTGSPPSAPSPACRVVVAQDGARLHYAIPLALQSRSALERMYVPWYFKPGSTVSAIASLVAVIDPRRANRMRERRHPGLDVSKVWTNLALAARIPLGRRRFATVEEYFAWESEQVGEWIARRGFGAGNALFGFVRNVSPALCAVARATGLRVIVDQIIATMAEERRQEAIQAERFPEWKTGSSEPHDADLVEEVEQRTWANADAVTCASDYVKASLVSQGVPDDKITVLPYPIEADSYAFVDRSGRPGPVTVGFVGSLGLRKGTPYFLEVAKRLKGRGIRFVLVGPTGAHASLIAGTDTVEVVGPVPRSEVAARLASFDVLLFPSTCEGSPGAVMEAMAAGLPVVSTPNSGTVVRDGVDGFIHPYDDIDALAGSVERLAADAALRLEMGRQSRARAEQFSIPAYADGLYAVVARAVGRMAR